MTTLIIAPAQGDASTSHPQAGDFDAIELPPLPAPAELYRVTNI
jgi:hypothetical protein